MLYIDDGSVATSAGVAAGIDLCLHLVGRDHGALVAARIARRMVVAPHRDGGQAQFLQRPVPGTGTDLPMDHVAARCGLGTAANLRLHLARDASTTPTAYRRTYRGRQLKTIQRAAP